MLTTLDPASNADSLLKVRPEAKLRAIVEINQALASTLQVETMMPKILDSLVDLKEEVTVDPLIAARARRAVERMVNLKS